MLPVKRRTNPSAPVVLSPLHPLLPTALLPALKQADAFAAAGVPHNTRRAYTSDWIIFSEWCQMKGVSPLPAQADTLRAFLADQSARVKTKTLQRYLSSINKAHELGGVVSPTKAPSIKETMRGIAVKYGTRSEGKRAATAEIVGQMVAGLSDSKLSDIRARAVTLIGLAGGFRNHELRDLMVHRLTWSEKGVVILVHRAKKDQEGQGLEKAVPFLPRLKVGKVDPMCAASALKHWLVTTKIASGPVFRGLANNGSVLATPISKQSIGLIVKSGAKRIGLDKDRFSAHSLRAGHVTTARQNGVDDVITMGTTGHQSREMLDLYDRRERPFAHTSAGAVLSGKPRGRQNG